MFNIVVNSPQQGSQSAIRCSTRLAVLAAAANFVGQYSQTRADERSEHVLRIADAWLAWVEQQ